ncbi:MAG: hypothetical protein LUG44_03115, partial [Clostridiales bacterium]|nr:hypothetical protein [Clostridiales bacterium]
ALEWHSRGQRFDPAYLHQISGYDVSKPPSSEGGFCWSYAKVWGEKQGAFAKIRAYDQYWGQV